MSRPLLVQRWRSTANSTCAVFKWVNGSLIQIGSDFGSDFTITQARWSGFNRVVHWNGKLYTTDSQHVYKYDPAGSGEWGAIWDIDNVGTLGNQVGRMGPVTPMQIDGESKLVFFATLSTNTSLVPYFMDKDENFEIKAGLTVTAGGWNTENCLTYAKSTVFQGNIVWYNTGNDALVRYYSYNPNGNTLTEASVSQLNPTVDNSQQPGMCPFQNNMYILGDSGTSWALYRVEGPDWVKLTDILGSPNVGTFISQFTSALYTDGDSMFALYLVDGTQDGYQLTQIEIGAGGIITQTDRTSNLPPHLIVNNGITNRNTSVFGIAFADLESNPGGEPEINLFYAPSDVENSSISMYKHGGISGAFEFLGNGGDWFQLAFPYDDIGGGHRTWAASGELDGFITSQQVRGTEIDFTYRITGGSGQAVNVRWYLSNQNEPPMQIATVVSASGGTVVNAFGTPSNPGTIISGVVADGLDKTWTWGAVTDGIGSTDRPILVPRFTVNNG